MSFDSDESPYKSPQDVDEPSKPDRPLKKGGRPTNVRWMMFVMACGTSWFLYLHRYTWNLIRPELQKEYDFSNTQLESMFTCFNLSYGCGQIPSGIVCDFFGPHVFLAVIIICWSLVVPFFGATGNIYAIGGLRALFGASQAGGYPGLSKVTQSWFPKSSRTIVQGWVATFFGRGGGAMASILMGTVLMGAMGLSWRMSLIVLSAAGVLFGLTFLWLFRNSPRDDSRVNQAERDLICEGEVDQPDAPRVLPLSRLLKNRSMLVFIFHQFLNAGADIIYVSIMGSYFMSAKGINIAAAGIFVSLPLWGGAIGGMIGGFCNDGLIRATGNRRLSRSIMGFSGKSLACLLMFVMLQQTTAGAAATALFAVKFFSDWSQPTVWGACTDIGGRYSATIFSALNTSGTLGGVVMALTFGVMLDYNTTQQLVDGKMAAVTNFNPIFFTVAIMYIVAALCWFAIDSTQSLDRPDDEPAAETA